MDSRVLKLQKLLKEHIHNDETYNLSLNICYNGQNQFVQQILQVFKESSRLPYLLLVSTLNANVKKENLLEYLPYSKNQPLSFTNGFLKSTTPFLSTFYPISNDLIEFEQEIKITTFDAFQQYVDQFKFIIDNNVSFAKLAENIIFNFQSDAQQFFQINRQPENLLNLLILLSQQQQKKVVFNQSLLQFFPKLNFSVSNYKAVHSSTIQLELKQQIKVISDILVILDSIDDQLLLQGPLYFLSQFEVNQQYITGLQLLYSELLTPELFLKLVIQQFSQLQKLIGKIQSIELLSMLFYKYCLAYSALSFKFAQFPLQIIKETSNLLIGFMLNAKDYSSILTAIQVKLSFFNVQMTLNSGQFLQIIFNLRKLNEIKVLQMNNIDSITNQYQNLYLFTCFSLIQQQSQVYAAKHINVLFSQEKQLEKIKNLLFQLQEDSIPVIQLYFQLLMVEMLLFNKNYFYGQLLFFIPQKIQQMILIAQNQNTIHSASISIIKNVQIIVQKNKLTSNVLVQRFKLIEYQIGNQVNKILTQPAISSSIKSIVQIFLQPDNDYFIRKISTNSLTSSQKYCRATLNKTHDIQILQNIDFLLQSQETNCMKVVFSEQNLAKNTFLYIALQNRQIFKIPQQTSQLDIKLDVVSMQSQPNNILLELEAIQSLQSGNIARFIIKRFQSLHQTLETTLHSFDPSQLTFLQKLDTYYMNFYNQLPFLLFGPLIGITRLTQTEIVTENIENDLDSYHKFIAKVVFQSIQLFKLISLPITQDQIIQTIYICLTNDQLFTYQLKQKLYSNFQYYITTNLITKTFCQFSLIKTKFQQIELTQIQNQLIKNFTTLFNTLQFQTSQTTQKIFLDPILNQIPLENTFAFTNTIRYLKQDTLTPNSQIPPQNSYFIDKSLPQTQIRIQQLLPTLKTAWQPAPTQLRDLLTSLPTTSHFLYAGHGGAENLLPTHLLTQLKQLPEAAILGCASLCEINFSGGKIRFQPQINWRVGSLVVGCLWDMLSGDLDRFAEGYLRSGMGSEGVRLGRRCMQFKWVFGVGIVVYG